MYRQLMKIATRTIQSFLRTKTRTKLSTRTTQSSELNYLLELNNPQD